MCPDHRADTLASSEHEQRVSGLGSARPGADCPSGRWVVDVSAGDASRPTRELVLDLVERATRAPSSHNTQPWRFRVGDGLVTLVADRARQLSVTDPDGRELVISCGAALCSLVLAAGHAELRLSVVRLPEGPGSDVLATVRLAPGAASTAGRSDATAERHTTRGPMAPWVADEELAEELAAIAEAHGVWLVTLESSRRGPVADLVAAGDRRQFSDRAWRAELASWMRPRRAGDGLTTRPLAGFITRGVVTHLDLGTRTARADRALAMDAPLLTVVGTDHDEPLDWLRAGEALHHLLLHAATRGLQAGFLNQPCQVADLRPRLAAAIDHPGFPQLLLRLGRPVRPARPSPRRPLRDVVDLDPADPAPTGV